MKKVSKTSSQISLQSREEETNNRSSFTETCAQCLRGPKQIIRTIILLTCTVVVIYQIAECMRKIRNPPTTTYTHFDFNESMRYPAVTLCRDPPYKNDILKKHGLIGHPRTTSEWRYFPYSEVTLDDFWEEATYNDSDNLINYALSKSKDNVLVVNHLHFIHGKCQTLYPKIDMTVTDKETGYSILLNHNLSDMTDTTSKIPPGYHLYIHQTDEPFVEPTHGTLVDYLYVNVGEELDVKLGVKGINMLVGGPKSCNGCLGYTVSECMADCRLRAVKQDVQCSGPWLDLDQLPRCYNYSAMKELIVNYIRVSEDVNLECPCLSRCRSTIYTTHVVDRNHMTVWNSQTKTYTLKSEIESEQTQVYIYFNSKTVSIFEEKHGYDWSLFLADFGGSLGFLLGLSVLGVITLLETLYEIMLKPMKPQSEKQEDEFVKNGYKKGKKSDESKNAQRRGGDGDSLRSEEFGEKGVMNNLYGDEKQYDKNFYI